MSKCKICGMDTANGQRICDLCLEEKQDLHITFSKKFYRKPSITISYNRNYVFIYIQKNNKYMVADIKKYSPEEVYKFMVLARPKEFVAMPEYTNEKVVDFNKFYEDNVWRLEDANV